MPTEEEAKRVGVEGGGSKPTDLIPDCENSINWQQWYMILWHWKLTNGYR
jgi:hypothetical protein